MSKIVVQAVLTAKDGQAVQAILAEVREETLKEEGCLLYQLHRSLEDDKVFMLYEVYRDAAALDLHVASEHYANYRERIAPLLADRQVARYEEI
ncbi:putative quinol monooxygenase [Exiguobacterium flavidum]|uniref:putative quinol monooxygenase n=1 Tax=Exiguobacterium flavidum TaxID=2184695 RepID=UPI000DF7D37D|nr:putative quinol monooxygenase [Exiguobacterium flavidum]